MRRIAFAATAAALALATTARAQPPSLEGQVSAPYGPPVNDDRVYVHGLLSEFEGRLGADDSFRWEGEGWVGGDFNRLWLKSEGEATGGVVSDGQQEAFYDRPVTTYFDLQAGARYDLDSYAGRGWAALGVEGFAPYYADVSATAYASDAGHYAAKIEAADEIRFTQRLILEPQAEIDLYTRDDPARRIGSGLSSLDAGLRLRYEIVRKFAPYVGVTYERAYGRTADYARAAGDRPEDLRLALGIRSWF